MRKGSHTFSQNTLCFLVLILLLETVKVGAGRCEDKIPADKIPTDKTPTTGVRCGCPDFLDLYMHAWFGPMVHVYIHILSPCRAA